MNDYATTWDLLAEAVGGYFTDLSNLTTDQRLQALQVAALLSVAQELSAIHHAGINRYLPD